MTVKKTKTPAGEWCFSCHHMLTQYETMTGKWKHADAADWAVTDFVTNDGLKRRYSDCGCVNDGRTCVPESERAVRKTRASSDRTELEPAENGRWRLAQGGRVPSDVQSRQMHLYMDFAASSMVPLSFAVCESFSMELRDVAMMTGRLGDISYAAGGSLTGLARTADEIRELEALPPEEPTS